MTKSASTRSRLAGSIPLEHGRADVWRSTCGTTTTSDRTEALRFGRRGVSTLGWRLAGLGPPSALGVGIASAAGLTGTARWRHDVRVSEPNGLGPASAARVIGGAGRTGTAQGPRDGGC